MPSSTLKDPKGIGGTSVFVLEEKLVRGFEEEQIVPTGEWSEEYGCSTSGECGPTLCTITECQGNNTHTDCCD